MVAFIGTTLGIFVGLELEKWKNKNKKDTSLINIKKEILRIKNDIENTDSIHTICYFKTPVWDSLIATGTFLDSLVEDKNLDKIIKIYNYIRLMHEIENLKLEYCTTNTNPNNINKLKKQICDALIKEIDEFLKNTQSEKIEYTPIW